MIHEVLPTRSRACAFCYLQPASSLGLLHNGKVGTVRWNFYVRKAYEYQSMTTTIIDKPLKIGRGKEKGKATPKVIPVLYFFAYEREKKPPWALLLYVYHAATIMTSESKKKSIVPDVFVQNDEARYVRAVAKKAASSKPKTASSYARHARIRRRRRCEIWHDCPQKFAKKRCIRASAQVEDSESLGLHPFNRPTSRSSRFGPWLAEKAKDIFNN